jgi:heme A synthase
MSAILLAEFAEGRGMIAAARGAALRQLRVLDAFTPFPVEELGALLPSRPSHIRLVMLLGGLAVAALAYGTEFYTAAIDYPYNSGGRPLHSWPAFMLVPFALGILGATVSGLAAFLVECGLPRLHHPVFEIDSFERASQDRFLLALARPAEGDETRRTIDWLHQAGALSIREVAT